MGKELKYLKKFNETLEKSIVCSDIDNFEKVIKKLHKLGYKSPGMPLSNVWIHETEWKRGMRVINLYMGKGVKFAASHKNLKNVIKDIDFLK